MNLYVANFDRDVTAGHPQDLFRDYGDVTSARIFINFKTGQSRGFGFVEMESDEDAEYAIAELNGKLWRGQYLIVSRARNQR